MYFHPSNMSCLFVRKGKHYGKWKEAQAWILEHLSINVSATCSLGHQERMKIHDQFSLPKLSRFGLDCFSTEVRYTDFLP